MFHQKIFLFQQDSSSISQPVSFFPVSDDNIVTYHWQVCSSFPYSWQRLILLTYRWQRLIVQIKLQGLGLMWPICCLGIAALQRRITGFFQLAINGKFEFPWNNLGLSVTSHHLSHGCLNSRHGSTLIFLPWVVSYCQLMEMEVLVKLTGEIKPRVSGQGIPWHLMVGAGGKFVLKQKEEDVRQAQSELWDYVHHWRAIPKRDRLIVELLYQF